MTRSERAAWGRVGGLTAQARHGGQAMTAPARDGFRLKWERMVDVDGLLDPLERGKRAEQALRAHMLRLAIASAEARATKRHARGDRAQAVGISADSPRERSDGR